MSGPRDAHRATVRLLAAAMVVIGVALLARTLAAGGGPLSQGVLLGVLFVAAGAGRLALARRER